jgi:hypothetical protein
MTMKKRKESAPEASPWVPATTPIDDFQSVVVWCEHPEGVTEWAEAYQFKGVWYDRAACVINHATHYMIPVGPKAVVKAGN